MAKKKGDNEIGKRAFEEVYRVFQNLEMAAKCMNCKRRLFYSWNDGTTPGGHHLAIMHYFGCDVLYILTGHRHKS